jgi:hypothetical protein
MDRPERRKEARYVCFGQVKLDRTRPGIILRGRVVDLSLGGCLIQMQSPVDVCPGASVELTIQAKGTPLRMMGSIKSAGEQSSGLIGISFTRLSSRGRFELKELIAELGASHARNRNGLYPAPRLRDLWEVSE